MDSEDAEALESQCSSFGAKSAGFWDSFWVEAGIHAVRRYIDNMMPGQVFVKIDFKNAFNSLRRVSILE